MKGSWRPWRWIVRPDPKKEVDEELRFHLEQRTRDYIDRGMSPESARKAAAARFGDPARVRDVYVPMLAADRASEARRTVWRVSWLDVKLGLRMFIKYPGLSLVSVTGMAVAIAIGAGYFTVLGTWLDATLPLPEGDRIVSIRNLVNGSSLDDASGADVLEWRDAMTSVRELGAFRNEGRNISTAGRTDVIPIAAMSASGFRVARVAPVMGRALVDDDERPGAPPAAAAIGLAILHVALKMIRAAIQHEDGAAVLPFLVDFKLSPAVIIYVTLLAVLAAVIAGVLPVLKATGKRVQQGLQQFSARAAGVQLGPTWTALIVL